MDPQKQKCPPRAHKSHNADLPFRVSLVFKNLEHMFPTFRNITPCNTNILIYKSSGHPKVDI